MKTETKTPTATTLATDYAAPFNQLLAPSPLSGGQPGVIQHAGLTKREYFAAQFMAAEINRKAPLNLTFNDLEAICKLTDNFIKALNSTAA